MRQPPRSRMDTFDILKQLTETPGPSGYEQPIAEAIRTLWQPLADEVFVDRLGSLLALKKGSGAEPRPRLLLAAHMDELGLMVTQLVEHGGYGFLRTLPLGGVDRRQLYGQLAVVHGKRPLKGIIGALPSSMLPEERRDGAYGYDDLMVDVGLPMTELESLVSVGDVVTFHQPLRKLQGKRVTGKALDNRASVTAVTVCLEALQGRVHQWDVVAVATVQEEVGLVGAYTATFAQNPDAAIAIDVGFGKGPGANGYETFELGGGPMIGFGPNVHPGLFKGLKDAAAALEMTVHTEPHSRYSGTDAMATHITRAGTPTGLVSMPLRYMHTMVESADLTDIERCGRLLAEFIVRLEPDFIATLTEEMMAS